jgi:glycosyltransferase involved in cell wall biosynthesis
MRIIGGMSVDGPALQVSTLMRGLDPDLFEQRLYVGSPAADGSDGPRAPDADTRASDADTRAHDADTRVIPALGRSLRPADDLRALAALTAAMREFQPDLVHTHTAKAGAMGRLAATLARVPVRVHTYFSPARTALVVRAERALARGTHRLLAVSQRVRDDLVGARVGRVDQYEVVPAGVSLPDPPSREVARGTLGLPDAAPVVAFVGGVTQIRRPDRLLAVAREVRQVVPDARFVVCGEGDLLTQTVSGAHGLGFTFLPWRPDVETVYAAADLVLLTSDHDGLTSGPEGLPVTLIEAALAQRPAVATAAGEVSEVVRHGETGLVTRADVPELATAVVRLLRDTALRRWMGARAAEHAQRRFGTARLVADTTELYQRLARPPEGRLAGTPTGRHRTAGAAAR